MCVTSQARGEPVDHKPFEINWDATEWEFLSQAEIQDRLYYNRNKLYTGDPSALIQQEAVAALADIDALLAENIVAIGKSRLCVHEWVDTGFRKSWCKHCNEDKPCDY